MQNLGTVFAVSFGISKRKGGLLKVLQIMRWSLWRSVKKSVAISSHGPLQDVSGCHRYWYLGFMLNTLLALPHILSHISVYEGQYIDDSEQFCIFSIPTCPSWRSLRHLPCSWGGIHSHWPFRRSPFLIDSLSQALPDSQAIWDTWWYLASQPLRVRCKMVW